MSKKAHILVSLCALLLGVPGAAHAATTIVGIVTGFTDAMMLAVPAALGVAVLVFVWGLALYILRAGDDEGLEEGRHRMFWGIVALFLIVSIWGIVVLLETMVGVGPTNTCPPPQIGENTVTDCF